MAAGPCRILLSEGSSLSAREAATALGLAGFRVEAVSSDPMCLARFSRFVARVHPAPASGSDSEGYLAAVLDVIARRSIDVLLAVREQAYVFAAARRRLPATLGVALADFAAFEQVQSKTAPTLLRALDVPQPATEIVHSAEALAAACPLPFFVKTAFGTASKGVWRIGDMANRDALARELEEAKAFGAGGVVQQPAIGPLERSQAVFDHGRLVAFHVYRQIAEGPGAGDVLKASVRGHPPHEPTARTTANARRSGLNLGNNISRRLSRSK
jgi:hypothetical protein